MQKWDIVYNYVAIFLFIASTDNTSKVAATNNFTIPNCTHMDNGSSLVENTTQVASCPTTLLTLNNSDYVYLGNGSLLYNNQTIQVVCFDEQGHPLICPPDNTIAPDYDDLLLFTTLLKISCSLSIVGNILVIVTYCIFKAARSAVCLLVINLCIANSVFDLLVVVGGAIGENVHIDNFCLALAILLHYFLLTQFTIMPCVILETFRSFYQSGKLKKDTQNYKHGILTGYLIFGWGGPLVIVLLSIILDFVTTDLVQYGEGLECWMNHELSAMFLIDIPIYMSVIFNMVVFIGLLVLIIKAYKSHKRLTDSKGSFYIRFTLAIFATSGIFWIVGSLNFAFTNPWFIRTVVLINGVQGLAIWIAFFCTRKTLRLYWNFAKNCKHLPKNSTNSR